jgi:hypothetical protein
MPEPESAPESASAAESRVQVELRECLKRLLAQVESWLFERSKSASEACGDQDFEVEGPPEWVANAANLLVQPYVQWLDGMNENSPTLEDFGKLVAGLKIGSDNGGNVAPVLALCGRFGTAAQARPVLDALREVMMLLSDGVKEILHKVEEFPAYETVSFYHGYETGLRHNLVDEKGKAIMKNLATPIYLFLVMCWPVVQQQGSVEQLHRFMGKFFPPDVLRDVDRLRGICKKIKLRLRKRGRPKKEKK